MRERISKLTAGLTPWQLAFTASIFFITSIGSLIAIAVFRRINRRRISEC